MRVRKNMSVGCALFVLFGMAILFQNCSSKSNPVMFLGSLSNSPTSQGSGDGDFYDGKPDIGQYLRLLPERVCGSDPAAPFGRLTVDTERAQLEEREPVTCQASSVPIDHSQLEFSHYNRRLISYRNGVYVKWPMADGGTQSSMPEIWCRRPDSTTHSGLDVVIETDIAKDALRSSIIRAMKDSAGGVTAETTSHINLKRLITGRKVTYAADGYSLEIDVGSSAEKSKARLLTQDLDVPLDCRLAGSLDPATSVIPSGPTSFVITGLTGARDSLSDSFLVGGLSPTLNLQKHSVASSYEVEIASGDGKSVVCSSGTVSNSLSSIALPGCQLQDGQTYLARLSAIDVYGAKIAASNSGYKFTVTHPANDTGLVDPVAVPGLVQFEGYDAGGEGVAYHDTTATDLSGQNVRRDGVDVFGASWGRGVDNIEQGEWLKITINATAAGNYAVDVGFNNSEVGSDPAFRIEVDGVNATGTIRPRIGTYPDEFPNHRTPLIPLSKGVHIIRFVMEGSKFRLSHMTWSLVP